MSTEGPRDKHRTRADREHRLIFIRSTSGGPDGHEVELIALTDGAAEELWRCDALDVADGCMAAWCEFLRIHQLEEPAQQCPASEVDVADSSDPRTGCCA